jgi:hypothetical protein
MAEKVLQIIPYPTEVRIAMYENGNVGIHKPTCLALVERGTTQEIVYMEMVDNVVERVDTEHKNFLGFVEANNLLALGELNAIAQTRYEKEQSVKPK